MKMKKWEIIALFVLIAGLSLWAFWPKGEGSTARVTVDGETVLEVSLLQEGEYPLEGYGGFSLRVMVEKGQVRVEESTCPDLICQNHAPISRAGEQIVCLPARIVVTITGEEAEADAVVG